MHYLTPFALTGHRSFSEGGFAPFFDRRSFSGGYSDFAEATSDAVRETFIP